jgi:hypothetical protein
VYQTAAGDQSGALTLTGGPAPLLYKLSLGDGAQRYALLATPGCANCGSYALWAKPTNIELWPPRAGAKRRIQRIR